MQSYEFFLDDARPVNNECKFKQQASFMTVFLELLLLW